MGRRSGSCGGRVGHGQVTVAGPALGCPIPRTPDALTRGIGAQCWAAGWDVQQAADREQEHTSCSHGTLGTTHSAWRDRHSGPAPPTGQRRETLRHRESARARSGRCPQHPGSRVGGPGPQCPGAGMQGSPLARALPSPMGRGAVQRMPLQSGARPSGFWARSSSNSVSSQSLQQ